MSLVVQWLRICPALQVKASSMFGQGNRIPLAPEQLKLHAAAADLACSGAHVPQLRPSDTRDQTRVSGLLHWQGGSLPLAPSGKLTNFSEGNFLSYQKGSTCHSELEDE